MENIKYDVVIVGAGPAGLFAAYELITNDSSIQVALIDMGKRAEKRYCNLNKKGKCLSCKPCHIMSGYGGAGTFSDGKLNFIAKLGKTDLYQFLDKSEADFLVNYVEDIFREHLVENFDDIQTYPTNMDSALKIKEDALKCGMDLMLIRQKHLGSDNLQRHISEFTNYLESLGVVIIDDCKIDEDSININNTFEGFGEYIIDVKGEKIQTKNLILAPGRVGSEWLQNIADKFEFRYAYRSIEIGVRVETRKEIMNELCSLIYDPSFFIRTKTYQDEIRTFCTNPGGYVSKENYQDFNCVNGHSLISKKSDNTNFAFISKIDLTEPITNTKSYGQSIGKLANILGDGKPILQRLGDLKTGKRSTWARINRSSTIPTLKDVVPGDISLVLPHRIVSNIIEGLDQLNKIIPGISNDDTLLYAPEIKFFSVQIETEKSLKAFSEKSIDNIYTIGDGAGNSGNIISAACTGVIAATDILKKRGIFEYNRKFKDIYI